MSNNTRRVEKSCRWCGRTYSVPRCREWRDHCCSGECNKKYRAAEAERKKSERARLCKSCGNEFIPRKYQIDLGQGRLCSNKCSLIEIHKSGVAHTDEACKKRKESLIESGVYDRAPRGEDHPQWKEKVESGGYWLIHTEDGKRLEHRVLMERHIGRRLTAEEVIHHVNGDKKENRIENLMIMTRAEHMDEHRDEIVAARNAD